MDPVLIVIIVVVAALAGPKLVKAAVADLIFKHNKERQANMITKEQRRSYKESKKIEKKQVKEQKKEAQIDQKMHRVQDISFKNIRTKELEKVRVSEIAEFNDDEDVLLKGRLHIVDSSGKKTVQNIYLFQPRLFSSETEVGPKINKFGNLSDENTYLCRRTGEQDILSGYVPKREVLSGMRFDYVTNGKRSFIERNPRYDSDEYSEGDKRTLANLERYIYIDIPTDENGNFIPVNLTNIDELREFQAYAQKHCINFKNNNITPEEYFTNELGKAERSLAKYIKEYEPTYIPVAPKVQIDDSDTVKVKSSKKPETSINDYYRRFDYYMNPAFGEKYNDYNGEYDTPHPPHHHQHR